MGAKILHSKSQLILHLARRHPLRPWRVIPRHKSHLRTYRTSPQYQFVVLEPEETRCGNTKGKLKIFQKIFNEPKKCLCRSTLYYHSRRSFGRMRLNKLMSTILEVTTDPNRKDLFEATPMLVWFLEVKMTKPFGSRVIEIKTRSVKKTGSNSGWLSAGVLAKYVTELSEWDKKPIYSLWKSVFKRRASHRDGRKRTTCTFLIFVTHLADQTFKVEYIPSVPKVIDDNCRTISNMMTSILRHEGYPREASEWEKAVIHVFIANAQD